jgi:Domain of unknown function (DUF5615)
MPSRFAAALRAVGYAAVSVHEVLKGADDEDVLRYCAEHKLAWVTQDIESRKKASYAGLINRHGVSVIFLRPPKKHGWQPKVMFSVLARDLPAIEDSLSEKKPCYWVCKEPQRAKRLRNLTERW